MFRIQLQSKVLFSCADVIMTLCRIVHNCIQNVRRNVAYRQFVSSMFGLSAVKPINAITRAKQISGIFANIIRLIPALSVINTRVGLQSWILVGFLVVLFIYICPADTAVSYFPASQGTDVRGCVFSFYSVYAYPA